MVYSHPLYIQDKNGKVSLNRKLFAKYTSGQRDISAMSDVEFLEYVTFIVRQQDVHIAEDAKIAINTTRNAKNIKTYSEFVTVSKTVMGVLLIGAILVLCILIPLYAYVFKQDVVKRTINYNLFPLTFYLITIFGFFVFLYLNMNSLVKKIMTLM